MTTLDKQSWLLLVLQEQPFDRIRLMKALFLIWHRSGRNISDFYEFVPYLYGPCSFDLYRELGLALQEQLVTQAPHPIMQRATYFLTPKGERVATSMRKRIQPAFLQLIRSVAKEIGSVGFYDLLRRVYAEAPDFASQSVVFREKR